MTGFDPNSEAGRAVMKAFGTAAWVMRCDDRPEREIDEFRKEVMASASFDEACIVIKRMTGGRVTVETENEVGHE